MLTLYNCKQIKYPKKERVKVGEKRKINRKTKLKKYTILIWNKTQQKKGLLFFHISLKCDFKYTQRFYFNLAQTLILLWNLSAFFRKYVFEKVSVKLTSSAAAAAANELETFFKL